MDPPTPAAPEGRGRSSPRGGEPSKLRRPRYARYAAPASLRTVKAVEELSRSTPTPNVAAAAHARMPTATPRADIVDARGPDASALRMINAVSGPGVAMSSADNATQASSRPSSSIG